EAENLRQGFGQVFPELPLEALGVKPAATAREPVGGSAEAPGTAASNQETATAAAPEEAPGVCTGLHQDCTKIAEKAGKQGGGAGNRTRVREPPRPSSFTCVAAVSPAAGFADSAATYPPLISAALSKAPSHSPARVVDTFEIRGRPLSSAASTVVTQREP